MSLSCPGLPVFQFYFSVLKLYVPHPLCTKNQVTPDCYTTKDYCDLNLI